MPRSVQRLSRKASIYWIFFFFESMFFCLSMFVRNPWSMILFSWIKAPFHKPWVGPMSRVCCYMFFSSCSSQCGIELANNYVNLCCTLYSTCAHMRDAKTILKGKSLRIASLPRDIPDLPRWSPCVCYCMEWVKYVSKQIHLLWCALFSPAPCTRCLLRWQAASPWRGKPRGAAERCSRCRLAA